MRYREGPTLDGPVCPSLESYAAPLLPRATYSLPPFSAFRLPSFEKGEFTRNSHFLFSSVVLLSRDNAHTAVPDNMRMAVRSFGCPASCASFHHSTTLGHVVHHDLRMQPKHGGDHGPPAGGQAFQRHPLPFSLCWRL